MPKHTVFLVNRDNEHAWSAALKICEQGVRPGAVIALTSEEFRALKDIEQMTIEGVPKAVESQSKEVVYATPSADGYHDIRYPRTGDYEKYAVANSNGDIESYQVGGALEPIDEESKLKEIAYQRGLAIERLEARINASR